MNLFILTTAVNVTASAVTSVTDPTPLEELPYLLLGDSVPLSIVFTDGSSPPSWAGNSAYSLEVGLGNLDTGGGLEYTTALDFAPQAGTGWTGRLNLNTQRLRDAVTADVGMAVNWSRFLDNARTPRVRAMMSWQWLQVRVVDPSGYKVTYAQLRVAVFNRVLGDVVAAFENNSGYAWAKANTILNAVLEGIAATENDPELLCGWSTANGNYPTGAKIHVSFPSNIQVLFELIATTADSPGFYFQPYDYDITSNARKWAIRSVTRYGLPALYNADTTLWHFVAAQGAADAVALAPDQTGIALPA